MGSLEASEQVRIVIWNIEWRRLSHPDGRELQARIAACKPDILCITEGYPDFLPLAHRIESVALPGPAADRERRKVLLWSRQPWTEVDNLGDPELPTGRYIGGKTSTPLGDVWVDGLCIPWFAAHVSVGRRDRVLWEEHMLYLDALRRVLHSPRPGSGRLTMGDYNQRIPQRRAPDRAFQALMEAFSPSLSCATSGPLPPSGLLSIDHLHHSAGFEAVSVATLSPAGENGRALSDHFGLYVVLKRASP